MLTPTQYEIIEFLLRHPQEQITIRGIAKRLKKSYTLVYNNISVLVKKKIITKTSVPPAQLISLHAEVPKEILIEAELKIKNSFLDRFSWAKLMVKDITHSADTPFFILAVFGSYAKNTQTDKSDIDLLVIVQDKNQIKGLEQSISHTFTKVKKQVIIVDINDFRTMLSSPTKLNVGNEARMHHIIPYGVEQYYDILEKLNNGN